MIQYLGEFLGTFILVLLGDGVVAGNVLSKTKEEGTGWVPWLRLLFYGFTITLIGLKRKIQA